jgi:hypothetical protein
MDENKGLALTSIFGSRFANVEKERRLQIRALGRMLEGIFADVKRRVSDGCPCAEWAVETQALRAFKIFDFRFQIEIECTHCGASRS